MEGVKAMKKRNEADEVFNKLSPMVNGLSGKELFTLAGFCILELVRQNIGYKNFNSKHGKEIYKELELVCNKLNKDIKTAFTLSKD